MPEGVYSLLDSAESMRHAVNKKSIIFKGEDAVLVIVRDFSTVENLQRKVAEEKFRSVLLSTITHDIKTPLTIIHGHLGLLANFVTKDGIEYFNAVFSASQILEYFIRDINVSFADMTRVGHEENLRRLLLT